MKDQPVSSQSNLEKPFFNFLKPYKLFFVLSIFAICFALYEIGFKGFNYGTDFTGGLEKIVFFAGENKTSQEVIDVLEQYGLDADVEKVLSRENTFVIRFSLFETEKEVVEKTFDDFLEEHFPLAEIEQTRLVSGVVSEENKRNAISTSLIVILLIVVYLTLRFEFRYALGALFAVVHDVAIMIGFVSLMGLEINVLTMVAVLTIFGYSVNDTIIVFDRIRELQRDNFSDSFLYTVSYAVRLVFARTLITSLTTLFVVSALFISTTDDYKDFARLLIIGIVSGTYSTIYVALPFLMIYRHVAKYVRQFSDKHLRKFFVKKR